MGNKAFGFTPDYIMGMSYFLFMTMLMDFNVMSERESGKKDEIKKGSGGDLAKYM